jgi:hypothetical protein
MDVPLLTDFRDMHMHRRAMEIRTITNMMEQYHVKKTTDVVADAFRVKRLRPNKKTYDIVTDTSPDEQVRALWRNLHNFRSDDGRAVEWSRDQLLFMRNTLSSCLPGIYGVQWDANAARVMRNWKFDRVVLQTLIRCPRQHGKTYFVAGFAAAYAASIAGEKKIAVFATGGRIAVSLLDTVFSFLNTLDKSLVLALSYVRGVTPCVTVINSNGGVIRVSAYPANPKISYFFSFPPKRLLLRCL